MIWWSRQLWLMARSLKSSSTYRRSYTSELLLRRWQSRNLSPGFSVTTTLYHRTHRQKACSETLQGHSQRRCSRRGLFEFIDGDENRHRPAAASYLNLRGALEVMDDPGEVVTRFGDRGSEYHSTLQMAILIAIWRGTMRCQMPRSRRPYAAPASAAVLVLATPSAAAGTESRSIPDRHRDMRRLDPL